MPKYNYRALPKVRDSLSYLYVERSKIEKTKEGVTVHNKEGSYQLPISNLNCLLLGPGTSYTQAAVVFPTHVGMNHVKGMLIGNAKGIPHARGDEPKPPPEPLAVGMYSPRTWG